MLHGNIHQLICYFRACDNLCGPFEVILLQLSLKVVEEMQGNRKSVDVLVQ